MLGGGADADCLRRRSKTQEQERFSADGPCHLQHWPRWQWLACGEGGATGDFAAAGTGAGGCIASAAQPSRLKVENPQSGQPYWSPSGLFGSKSTVPLLPQRENDVDRCLYLDGV